MAPTPTSSAAVRFGRFLGKVQFTMLLLVAGTAAMVAGTLIESAVDADTARAWVYRTLWFDLYLFLIAVNLLVAVLNRIPIRRHQWAFVVTHASIILLLLGAWISRTFGYEGRLTVREGESERMLYLDDAEFRARVDEGEDQVLRLGSNVGLAGRTLWTPAPGVAGIRIAEFIPDGEHRIGLVDAGPGGPPGLEVHLCGMGVHVDEWLIGDSPINRRKDLGPFEVELAVLRSADQLRQRLEARDSTAAAVVIAGPNGGEPARIELPRQVGAAVELAGGMVARVVRFAQRARVAGADGIVDDPHADVNPAAIVELRGGERCEIHTLFSEFPDFDVVKGRNEAPPLAKEIRLDAVPVGSKPLVSIIVHPGSQQLYVQLAAPQGRGEALPFEPGRTIGVGNLGLDLKVLAYLPSARPQVTVTPASSKDAGRPWMRVLASLAGAETSLWLRYGSPDLITLGERRLALGWIPQRIELPFTITLHDFEIDHHAGSTRPAQFRSHVAVRGDDGDTVDAVISMNRPLDHAGMRLFQSSYRLGEDGGPPATILSISRDPGAGLVYLSFAFLLLGVGWYMTGSGRRTRTADVAP